jgi:hypothetical protein
VGWSPGAVLVGNANYEDGLTNGAAVSAFAGRLGEPTELVALDDSSIGPLAVVDYNGNGMLGLFVGGRIIPGRYPVPASSRLYRQEGGKLVLDEANTARLKDVGLVSAALWSDLDGDGYPELILACEWGPIRVFHNYRGVLTPIDLPVEFQGTKFSKLSQITGWWNGITTGDLDGDGRPDIIALNWGRNTKYRASPTAPQRIYYGNFNGDGMTDIIEATRDESGKQVPERDLDAVAERLGFVRARFPTYAAYGLASVPEILGEAMNVARAVEANTLDSLVLFNRSNHLVAVPLPPEAQFSPAFAACVGDYDGDGLEDVFLSQNFFATELKTPRCDAGRGLWLRGDGRGGLQPVPGQESGVMVYGEQRGAALCDYDHDGRVDLVVTQNGAETRLFHNVGARTGLRVGLAGPAGNPCGIGAVIRLEYGDRMGPAREVHGGSGYWSQDAAVQVMGASEPATKVWVRWPGGKITTAAVPGGVKELLVSH